jgi:hypothetical protein
MANEKFDKVILEIPGEETKALTPEEFRAIPIARRVDLLCKGQFKFYKEGAALLPMDALKAS